MGKKESSNKKRASAGGFFRTLILLIALGVFCYSGYTLLGFYMEYKKASDEYADLASAYADDQEEQENQQETASLEELEEIADSMQKEADTEGTLETDAQGIAISGNFRGWKMAETIENEQVKMLPLLHNPIDFASLQEINEDVCAWLKLRAINISLPVVQGEDNEYYLHHTYQKEEVFAGCLFVNTLNHAGFVDSNTIIYGHNMKNGTMFGKLSQYGEEEIFNKSKYFWIYTPKFIYQYRIFSGQTVSNEGLTYQTWFHEDEWEEFITTAMEHSVLDNQGITISDEDRVVTLSTCTGDEATRFVLQGVLVQVYGSREYWEAHPDEAMTEAFPSEEEMTGDGLPEQDYDPSIGRETELEINLDLQ